MATGGGAVDKDIRRAAAELADQRSECVRVVVRVRPLSRKEQQDGRVQVIRAFEDSGVVEIRNPRADDGEAPKHFTFDHAYGERSAQRDIYTISAAPIIESVLQGYNGTIFAYGQTGSGKTFTMSGEPDPPELRGIVPSSFKHVFDAIAASSGPGVQHLVRVSFLEIYNESIRDLLVTNPQNSLELKESTDTGTYVKGLRTIVVKSASEIDHVMAAGNKNRHTGETLMNISSSRSHSIFTVTVEGSEIGMDGEGHIHVGKLNMVDLAGSERQSKTGATGERFKEATKINLSLSALGNVISALVDGRSTHIPYRDSKLTRLLQDSLGGNTKTVMIANCGPADYNYDETLSTLRYASRAKKIKNKPMVNEDPKDAMLREFQEEIKRLRDALAAKEAASAATRTIMIDGKEVEVPVAVPEVVERVVERIVEKEVGVSEEKMRELEERASREREALERRAADEREAILRDKARTEEERVKLEAELQRTAEEHVAAEKSKGELEKKIRAMQEKLIVGGRMLDLAAQQEAALRLAQVELDERRRQEEALARELEEANVQMEEQYASLTEEVEAKTRKLKKVYLRWKAAQTEIEDLQQEFQTEKEDMLDTIRDLQREQGLMKLVLEHFVPADLVERIKSKARFNEETAQWSLPRVELAGNAKRRPMSNALMRRAESEYARSRRAFDTNPRYRADNIARLEFERADRTTKDYDGPGVAHEVAAAIDAALVGDDEELLVDAPENLPEFGNPYLSYEGDDARGSAGGRGARKEKAHGRAGTRAPRSTRGRDYDTMGGGRDDDDDYPAARGLVGRG